MTNKIRDILHSIVVKTICVFPYSYHPLLTTPRPPADDVVFQKWTRRLLAFYDQVWPRHSHPQSSSADNASLFRYMFLLASHRHFVGLDFISITQTTDDHRQSGCLGYILYRDRRTEGGIRSRKVCDGDFVFYGNFIVQPFIAH